MSASRRSKILATPVRSALALLCAATSATACWGQAYGVEEIVNNNDMRWFEPAELDLDGRIEPDTRGMFFSFNKSGYWTTGERLTIGQEGLSVASEKIYEDNQADIIQQSVNAFTADGFTPEEITAFLGVGFIDGQFIDVPIFDDDGNQVGTFMSPVVDPTTIQAVFEQYAVHNGIQDATPDAKLGWGEEYRFGYSDGERGWAIEIVDGPEAISQGIYGAGALNPYNNQSGTGQADFSPGYGGSPQDIDGDGVLDPTGPINEPIFTLGFGSVPVNFNLPNATYLDGFRDYMQNIYPIGTVYGPVRYIGNYGAVEDTSDPDDDEVAGIADDVNGNGIPGFGFVLADLNRDGTIDDDEIVGTFTDFGDAYTFNVFYNTVTTRNRAEMNGIELMLTHEIDTRHRLERGRNDYMQLSYGVRFLQFEDQFEFEGDGSILGYTTTDTLVENQIIGPQVALRYRRDRGRWDFSGEARFMFGYNIVDVDQNNLFAAEAIPGALNRSAVARATYSAYGKRDDDFSPMGQLRFEARYKLSKAIALKAGYNIQYIDNVYRASRSVAWNAPGIANGDIVGQSGFGIRNGKSDVIINGLTFGVDLRY